jgi:transcriptional antiterminator
MIIPDWMTNYSPTKAGAVDAGPKGKTRRKTVPDKHILDELYTAQRLPLGDVAQVFDVSPPTVSSWLKEHGIQVRPPSKNRSYKCKRITARQLDKMYTCEKLSLAQVGEVFNVSQTTIVKKLKKFGIKTRVPGTPKTSLQMQLAPSKYNWSAPRGIMGAKEEPSDDT